MHPLPPEDELYQALVNRDTSLDGVFFAGIRTTGVFCRPGCGARKPNRENVEYFPTVSAALHAGYRPCRRCRPLEPAGSPPWLREVLALIESAGDRRLTAHDLRARGLEPSTVSRYFKARHGLTFHGYQRARRVGSAMVEIRRAGGGARRKPGAVGRAAARAGFSSSSGFREAFSRMFGAPPSDGAGAVALRARWIETPLGPVLAVAGDDGLCLLEFVDRRGLPAQIETLRRRFGGAVVPGPAPHLDSIEAELSRYFAGRLTEFRTPLAIRGTPFQEQVWAALRAIPLGATRSYAQIAREIGRPSAVRAVARANGDNRLAIIIPCHRVIGSDGSATGYGGGVWRKLRLLELERDAARGLGLPTSAPAGLFEGAAAR
ncbi:MAG: methylated-DNA--[protein]-cysteine S-methyltransferase [Phycisphaerales bacterium]|nr:methylated-DNA--[protein]-cysteine S-methyltransferase [Phycisphaerales bacterium]